MSFPDLPEDVSDEDRLDAVDPDPFRQFRAWYEQAAEQPLHNAMTLATTTPDGRPSARMVLLRGLDERGFCFFTHFDSRKARELTANPRAALVFYWPALERQVRVEGRVERTSDEESDAYFQTRPRGSQLGAWASPQSQVLADRATLERLVADVEARFQGRDVPRPPFWGGFRVVPDLLEFWQGRRNRLHDRWRYRAGGDGRWLSERVAP